MTAFFQSSADRVAAAQVRSVWAHFALGLASALPLALAFPRPGWGLLAYIGLAPMTLLAAWSIGARRLAWTFYPVAFAWWLHMVSWLYPVTGGGFIGLAALMAAYWLAYVLIWRLIHRRFGWPAVLTVPAVWVTIEYLRGTILSGGFGWFALAHSQAPYEPGDAPGRLIQTADLFGEWTVSFIVAMSSGVIVDVVLVLSGRGAAAMRAPARRLVTPVAIWLIVLVAAHVYGSARLNVHEPGEAIGVNVAVVQTNVPQSNKRSRDREQLEKDFARLLNLTRAVAEAEPKPSVIVLPETVAPWPVNQTPVDADFGESITPGFSSRTVHEALVALAAQTRCFLVVGSLRLERGEDDSIRKYNAAIVYSPTRGRLPDLYSKTQRVPFGEYIPWVEDWPWLKRLFMKYISPYGAEHDYTLTPGDDLHVFELSLPVEGGDGRREVRIITPICFEDAVPRVTRRMCYDADGKRCDIMLNLTNDGWYHPSDSDAASDQGPQHVQMAVFRCIENRVPMARSVNTGVSGFIDSSGRIIAVVTVDGRVQRVEGAVSATMFIDGRRTVFGAVGQWPVIVLVLATGAAGLAAARARRPRGPAT